MERRTLHLAIFSINFSPSTIRPEILMFYALYSNLRFNGLTLHPGGSRVTEMEKGLTTPVEPCVTVQAIGLSADARHSNEIL